MHPSDYRVAERTFEDKFGHYPKAPSFMKGKNIMTPNVLGIFFVAGTAVEISTGSGFDQRRIFGITVSGNHELSQMCDNWEEIEQIIKLMERG